MIREGGRPVAVLPVSLIDGLDPLGQLRGRYPLTGQELGLLSHVWHCYDAGLPELSDESCLRAAVGALRELARDQGAAWYGFVNVPHGSPLRAGLTGLGFPAVHIEDRFQLDLRGLDSVESYFAALPRSGRANLRRNRRRATEAGVSWQVRPAAEADLAEIGGLCAKTAARHGTGGFYPTDLFTGFVAALGDLAVAVEVRQGDRLIAAGVCLRDEIRFHAWACGVDYDVVGGFSPYPLLHAATVEEAIAEGRAVFEGGRGNHVFKLRHGLSRLALDACLLEV
ncbi:GNAT family N-acetyltransferase [Acrocarpospora catenulata]|uniref:GNAT family N-acetyltransferase n=1 Tax=Acrocarpospora catenulata TaxID=2836182 RepID=UPI001BDA7C5C|nr:GNAT family N-acetyltransferase [Acrocarpospora catenulata]